MARKLINIDGTDLEVMDYHWSLDDQDLDSGRNLSGYMERELLDHSVNTLDIIFPPLNDVEMSNTLQLLHKETLICRFLSPYSNTIEEHKMMHGNLTTDLYWNIINIEGQEEILYKSFKVQLVEY